MTDHQISDLKERNLALDPAQSFIVQAPAGSGKTSLLVARYLRLLATVNNPEEITAITFTRKAAFEMRSRIIDALKKSNENIKAKDQYDGTIKNLAKEALKQNQIKKWDIIQNPNRLRIQTIDAFCYYLVSRTPIFTKINTNFQIVQNQDAEISYHKAAQAILENLNEPKYSNHLELLLLHLNNNWERAENLFVTMLKSREQWLPHIVGLKGSSLNNRQSNSIVSCRNLTPSRQIMEKALNEISQENIERCVSLFPQELHQELIELLRFSKNNHENPPPFLREIESTEELFAMNISKWQGVAEFLLTKEFSWRKKVTKDLGFPAPSSKKFKSEQELFKLMKTRMEELLNKFSEHENLRTSLENLLLSPLPTYSDGQWNIIEALLELLPLLAAHLKVILDENMVTDHAEISMAALRALGNQDSPSDFALNLDYRLQHLLVDEFQDTSLSHYRLLEKITTTWQVNDGRTIFVVGDPMQSIYRFREAEVGIFLRAQHEGIGDLKLQPLTLTTNFRSSQKIIDWINTNFAKILPPIADIGLGAVPFKPSSAVLNNPNSLVAFTLLKEADARNEATQVVSTIQEIINNHPNDTIAILVKARTHLQSIIPKLREANLNHQAFELETLRENMVIRDLFSLTRSLFNLTDRIAWIAILRAPWCGLDLEDLYKTVRGESPIIWENICNHQNLDLSKDGESRLIRLKSALIPIFTERGRITWRELIEKAWLRIGGPATVTTESELEHAQAYLELLNDPLDIEALQKKLDSLYTPSTATTANIQLMTIHKSKGLEFDHVIIPGINRPTRFENHKLMLWFERPKLHHGSSLILAPITASGSNSDHVYQYLQLVEQKKITYETGRLLYVAMTRAKKSIHLIGCIKDNKENFIRNSILSGTLLEQLKPCFNEDWDIKDAQKTGLSDTTKELPPKISRLGSDWQLPITLNTPSFNNTPYFELIDNQPSIIGTIIHHCFRQISESKLNDWNENHIINQHPYWRKLLQQLGYLDLEHGLKLINEALTKTLKDERGRWILTQHQDAKSELAITAKINHKFVNYIIDRTFIDDGIRWIIDYKTSRPDEESIQDFQNQEADQYSKQLLQYANAMQSLDPKHKIRLGLYFPLFSGWIEIKPSSRSGGAKL